MTIDEIRVDYYYQKRAKVIINHIDNETKEKLTYEEVLNGHRGNEYTSEQKQLAYYNFIKVEGTPSGKMEQDETYVTYIYEKKKFDLRADKWISTVTINGMGQKAKTIDTKDELYKLEIRKKEIVSTVVSVTYKIRVSNVGEIAGTAQEIAEKIPEGFTYKADQNKVKWIKSSNGELSTDYLKNEILQPGEYKEIELTIEYNGGDNNFGTKTNQVILSKLINSAGFEDINSENNSSKADMLISIATGIEKAGKTVLIAVGVLIVVVGINIKVKGNKKRK